MSDGEDDYDKLSDKDGGADNDSVATEKNNELWKVFGRESEAGKLLFSLYRNGKPPKIDYPKPKMKPKTAVSMESQRIVKPCPQKTMINYPELPKPVEKKIHAVDLIPKRKNVIDIQREMDDFKKNPIIPENKGKNRADMVEKLQAKFKKGRGALPKGAELPKLEGDISYNEEEIKQMAMAKLGKNMIYMKPEKKVVKDTKKMTKDEEDEELNKLYDEIENEIVERQKYLDDMDDLDEPEIKTKIKKEIVERVSELQKIIKMMNQE
jgi:hypothetical protein